MSGRGDTQEFTLASGAKRKFSAGASSYLFVNQATDLIAVQFMQDRQNVGPPHVVAQRHNLKGRSFDEFVVENISSSSNTVRIFYGPGDYDPPGQDNVNVGNTVDVNISSGSVTVNESQPTAITPLADKTVTSTPAELVAANADSLFIEIAIPDDQTNGIRIGDSTVTASKGRWIGPGMTASLQLQDAAVWAVRDGAADVTVTLNRLDVP